MVLVAAHTNNIMGALCLQVKAQWVFMALVVDRLLLYAYLCVCGFSTVFIYMNAPALYDRHPPLSSGVDD
jgi:hypothetical protein